MIPVPLLPFQATACPATFGEVLVAILLVIGQVLRGSDKRRKRAIQINDPFQRLLYLATQQFITKAEPCAY